MDQQPNQKAEPMPDELQLPSLADLVAKLGEALKLTYSVNGITYKAHFVTEEEVAEARAKLAASEARAKAPPHTAFKIRIVAADAPTALALWDRLRAMVNPQALAPGYTVGEVCGSADLEISSH